MSSGSTEDYMVQAARLWSQAQPLVGAVVAGAVGDFHEAEDVVSQIAEAVVRNFSSYDRSRPFKPWVLGITRNIVLRYYEKRAGTRPQYFDEQVLKSLETAHVKVSDEYQPRLAALRECLNAVRGKSRRVLELRYFHGLKVEAIADALEMNRVAVRVMLHRVRGALRVCIDHHLAEEGRGLS